MTKGWRSESRRHALAAKGIKSTDGRIQTTLPTITRAGQPTSDVVTTGPIKWNMYETGFGVYDESIKNPDNPHRHYDMELVWMSPSEFIEHQILVVARDLQLRGEIDSPESVFYRGYSRPKIDAIMKKIDNGEPLDVFFIEYDENNELVPFQEGRHRILVAKKLGIDEVPVWLMKRR